MKSFLAGLILLLMSVSALSGQTRSSQRIPLIGSEAPSFKAPSTNGPIHFPGDFPGQWKILFAHPRDFTPVCSSELLELAQRQDEFNALNTQLIVISVDKMVSHLSWKSDLEQISYKGKDPVRLEFPLVVDSSYAISYKYGMVDSGAPTGQSVRGVFFVDPADIIRAFQFYPNEVGRNTEEILRTLRALQEHDRHENTVLPANWQPGDDYMLPFLTPEDKEELKKDDSSIHYINWYMIFKHPDKIH